MAITTNGGAGVTADAVATLTNKTLTAPVISNATFTGQQSGLEIAFNQSIVFEGTTADAFETTLSAGEPTADRTVTLPDATGQVVLRDTTDTLTNKTLTTPVIDNPKLGYTTTATAAGTTTLTATSNYQQFFTGSTTQTIVLPVASTMTLGMGYFVENLSSGNLTVNSSGGNLVVTVTPGITVLITCVLTSGTSAASWDVDYHGFATITGTGAVVLATSPTLVTPTLGVATATSINGTSIPSSKTLVATDSTAYVVPSQTGNSGKYLTTNGTASSWASIITDPSPTVFMMMGA